MSVPRLLTIRFSHYCEKARWALDWQKVPFVEDAHAPLVTWLYTGRLRGKKSVPILFTAEGVLRDSNDIVAYADTHRRSGGDPLVTENPEHAELQREFDEALGPATRRYAYWFLLRDAQAARRVLSSAGPALERTAVNALSFVLRAGIQKGLRVDEQGAERSRNVIERVFAQVADRIRDGRPYLFGDRFTAADLAFASLAAPIVFPEAYMRFVPRLEHGPKAFIPIVEAYRATKAGRFALSLYERQRDR